MNAFMTESAGAIGRIADILFCTLSSINVNTNQWTRLAQSGMKDRNNRGMEFKKNNAIKVILIINLDL